LEERRLPLKIRSPHDGDISLIGVPTEILVQLYRTMLLIRQTEERLADALLAGEIRCPVHLYTGQEAVAAGVCAHLNEGDYVFGTHRSHGHYLAKGGGLNAMIAEIYGRTTGCARGRGGSMHVIDPDLHIYATPIVASTISNAVGAALVVARKKNGNVAVSFFGDGAAEEGRFYESLNLASLYQLPVLFVCENNIYASHVRQEARQRNPDIHKHAEAFAMPGVQVDGNDVCAVYRTAQEAVERARGGGGPTLIECLTYRWRGHVGPNYDLDKGIRDVKELEAWQARCPIKCLGKALVDEEIQTEDDIAATRLEVDQAVEEAFAFAKSSPLPDATELLAYVTADAGENEE
jgi:TPP-dependent pyruvate/acetoin dehydrogenase alpha subunit